MSTNMTLKDQMTVAEPIVLELGQPVLFVDNAPGKIIAQAGRGEGERLRRDADVRVQAFRAWGADVEAAPVFGTIINGFVATLRQPPSLWRCVTQVPRLTS
jgi:hypothetical protein